MRTLWQLVGVLLVVGFVLKYWWILALVVLAVVAWKAAPGLYRRHRVAAALEQRRRVEIAARADQQHRWVLAGDERGIYGPVGAELMRDIRTTVEP